MSLVYLTDTNLYRYSININQQTYQQAAQRFWSRALFEAATDRAVILIPREVEVELTVQKQTFSAQDQSTIELMLQSGNIVDHHLPTELEYELRVFSNYIRTPPFLSQIAPPNYNVNYLRTADARILVAAVKEDAVLVTANIKDFVLYTLFFDENEDKLYDFLNQRFIKVPATGRRLIEQDPMFQSLKTKLESL